MAGGMTLKWWKWLPIHPWRLLGFVESADEIPDKLPRNGIVVAGSPALAKWIAFDCPCRTGHRIMLNIDPGREPAWRIDLTRRHRVTIRPSVDFADGRRRCHYVVDDGRIRWTRDSFR
jgi:hypothetical protein